MRISIFHLLFFLISCVQAQDTISFNKETIGKRNMGLEVGGVGLLHTLYYEQHVKITMKSISSIRAGLSYQPYTGFDQVMIPLEYTLYFGKGKYKLLVGAGIIGLVESIHRQKSMMTGKVISNYTTSIPILPMEST